MRFLASKTLATVALAALCGLAAAPRHALAQTFPSKPVRIIYPFAPGGGMEVATRVIAKEMQNSTGQPFVVENRVGAGAALAAQAVATAAADGYTLFVGPVGIMAITPHLRKLPYDTLKDLQPIARLSQFRGVLVVSTQVPANNGAEFIAYAKANPGKLSYGSAGVGSQGHVNSELLQQAWGIKLVHIPYKGAAEAATDLISGRLDVYSDLTMLQYVKQGKAKLLAVYGDARFPDFPDVSTLKEQRAPAMAESETWFGAFAPRGTPPQVIEKLASEFEKALRQPEVVASLQSFMAQPAFLGPQAFGKLWEADYARYGKAIADAGIKVE